MATSYQPNKNQRNLFAKGHYSNLGFVMALLLSLSCMVLDAHYQYLSLVRNSFSFFVAPIQYTVDYPVRIFSWIQNLASSKKALVNENMQLRYQQTLLEAKLQKLLLIRNENTVLKELLKASVNTNRKVVAAQILAVDTNHARQLLVINKGRRDGVFQGQPVLDAKGVMGQIIDVGAMTSTMLLISDSKSAVPVQNNRTGERAILVGTNHLNQLSLINLPKTSSIKSDDLLITSGLGRRYPEGYPVGKVSKIRNIPGEEFVTVTVAPIARLNRNRLVLLIWPGKEYAAITNEIRERMLLFDTQGAA